ncbi:MAG: hypothetical protein WCT31_00370 [Candidatus Micrarchaeia archaeon]|jgi:signal peptidase I
MDIKEVFKNAYFQAALLVIALILYLISPNDGYRLIFGVIVVIVIIGLVFLEIKQGAKEHGWKNEFKDTLLTLVAAVIIWYAIQFLLNTNSPISAVVTCSMLPNLQRGDFAIVQGASPAAYSIEMTQSQFDSLYGDARFSFGEEAGQSVKGSIYSYCIYLRPEMCKQFVSEPEKFVEIKGPLTFHYSACSMDIRNKGVISEPCVTSVTFEGNEYPINLKNDVMVYQPGKTEIYSLYGDIIHRAYFKITVKETGKVYYLTKGDNNQVLDIQVYDYTRNMGNDPISQDRVKGKLIANIPYLGYYKLLLSGFFTEPQQCTMQLRY